jgi:hypothetical protein
MKKYIIGASIFFSIIAYVIFKGGLENWEIAWFGVCAVMVLFFVVLKIMEYIFNILFNRR